MPPVHDPEWDEAVAALSQWLRENGKIARTTAKGGSLIVKDKRR